MLEHPRSRREGWPLRLLVLTVVLGVGAVLALTVGPLRPSSPADEVRDLVQLQIGMWNRGDFAALYQTLSPGVRRVCQYSVALDKAGEARAYSGEITLENLGVRVAGATASVTGILLIPGEDSHHIRATDPAIYTRIGDRWYLDSVPTSQDPTSLCRASHS